MNHVLLNQTLSVDSEDKQDEPRLSCTQLKLLAKEAELNKDYQQAAQYYQEVNFTHLPRFTFTEIHSFH